MRFINLIEDITLTSQDNDIDYVEYGDKLKKFIQTNCSEFLSQRPKGKYLYRGIKNPKNLASIQTPREDRNPMDTSPRIHELLNSIFLDNGIEARRDNSFFTTGRIQTAKRYGDLHLCFPLNGYVFSWSKKYRDLYVALDTDDVTVFYRNVIESLGEKQVKQMYKTMIKDGNSPFYKVITDIMERMYDDLEYIVSDQTAEKIRKGDMRILTRMAIREFEYESIAEKVKLDIMKTYLDKFIVFDMMKIKTNENSTIGQAIASKHEVLLRGQALFINVDIFNMAFAGK